MTAQQSIKSAIEVTIGYINKMRQEPIADNKYLAVFPDIMLGVQRIEGEVFFGDEPYSYETAWSLSQSVRNGHGNRPIIMSHEEYVTKSIEMQEKHLETLTNLETANN